MDSIWMPSLLIFFLLRRGWYCNLPVGWDPLVHGPLLRHRCASRRRRTSRCSCCRTFTAQSPSRASPPPTPRAEAGCRTFSLPTCTACVATRHLFLTRTVKMTKWGGILFFVYCGSVEPLGSNVGGWSRSNGRGRVSSDHFSPPPLRGLKSILELCLTML